MTAFAIFEKLLSFCFRTVPPFCGPALATSIGSSSGSLAFFFFFLAGGRDEGTSAGFSLHSSLRTALGGSWSAPLVRSLSGMAKVDFSVVSGFQISFSLPPLSPLLLFPWFQCIRLWIFLAKFRGRVSFLRQSRPKCLNCLQSPQLGHPALSDDHHLPTFMYDSIGISLNPFLFKQTRKE